MPPSLRKAITNFMLQQNIMLWLEPGESIPLEAMMHFPRVSDSPLFPKNVSDSVKNFHDLAFSEKNLVITHKYEIFPLYFRSFSSFSPISQKSIIPSTLSNLLPDLIKCPCFVHASCDFPFPLL